MSLTYGEVKREVKRLLTPEIFHKMQKYIKEQQSTLQSEKRLRTFVKRCFVMKIYHNLKKKGYNKLLSKVKALKFKLNHKSFKYNTKLMKKTLAR